MKLKPSLSEKNPYRMPTHRYYELKHFCLQEPEWEKALNDISYSRTSHIIKPSASHESDYVSSLAISAADLSRAISLIKRISANTDAALYPWIFAGVTTGLSYQVLNARAPMPCGRDYYYSLLRKFYWLLSREKGL